MRTREKETLQYEIDFDAWRRSLHVSRDVTSDDDGLMLRIISPMKFVGGMSSSNRLQLVAYTVKRTFFKG